MIGDRRQAFNLILDGENGCKELAFYDNKNCFRPIENKKTVLWLCSQCVHLINLILNIGDLYVDRLSQG